MSVLKLLAIIVGPWLWLAVCVIIGKFIHAQWEEDEIRRITPHDDDDLPDNWRELDSYGSWRDACAEMQRRNAGGND